jgi:hypothetical protein
MAGFEAHVKVLDSQLTQMRQQNEKMMSLFEKVMDQQISAPPFLPASFVPRFERERPSIVCYYFGGVEYPVESCWKLHVEKRPAKLGAMSGEPSLISGLKSMLEECESRIPDILSNEFLKML